MHSWGAAFIVTKKSNNIYIEELQVIISSQKNLSLGIDFVLAKSADPNEIQLNVIAPGVSTPQRVKAGFFCMLSAAFFWSLLMSEIVFSW